MTSHTFRYVAAGTVVAGGAVELTDADTHHLVRVVRRGQGDQVEVIDDAGRIWPGVVDELGPPARVRVAQAPRHGPPTLPVDLFVGLLEWGRLDLVVENARSSASTASWSSRRSGVGVVATRTPSTGGWSAWTDSPMPQRGNADVGRGRM